MHEETRSGGLAATGLADNTERLTRRKRKVDTIDRPYGPGAATKQPALQREVLHQALHLQQGCACSGTAHALMSMADRSPSVSRLKEIEVMKIITPGSAHSKGWV